MNPLNLNLGNVAQRIRQFIERPATPPAPWVEPPPAPPLAPAPEESRFQQAGERVVQELVREQVQAEVRRQPQSPPQSQPQRADAPKLPAAVPAAPAADGSLEAVLGSLTTEKLEQLTVAMVKSVGRAAVLETRLEALMSAAGRSVDPQRFEPLVATVEREVHALLRDVAGAQALVPPAALAVLAADGGSGMGMLEQLERLGKQVARALNGFDALKNPDQLKQLKLLGGELRELSVLAAKGGAAAPDQLPTSVREAIYAPPAQGAGQVQKGSQQGAVDPVVSKFLELYFQDAGEFSGAHAGPPRMGAAKVAAEALAPQKVAELAGQVAQEALGLSPEQLAQPGMKERVGLWSLWGTNRLIEHGGDAAAAKQALAGDLLRSPDSAPLLIRELKQALVKAFERGDLPAQGAEQLLHFIDQHRLTLIPQWLGELVSQRQLPSREALHEQLVERIEERVFGEEDPAGGAGRRGDGGPVRGRVQLRGRLKDGTVTG